MFLTTESCCCGASIALTSQRSATMLTAFRAAHEPCRDAWQEATRAGREPAFREDDDLLFGPLSDSERCDALLIQEDGPHRCTLAEGHAGEDHEYGELVCGLEAESARPHDLCRKPIGHDGDHRGWRNA